MSSFPIRSLGVKVYRDMLTMADKAVFQIESDTNKAGCYFTYTSPVDLTQESLDVVLDMMWKNAKETLLRELFCDK